jgi:hypothetical protein
MGGCGGGGCILVAHMRACWLVCHASKSLEDFFGVFAHGPVRPGCWLCTQFTMAVSHMNCSIMCAAQTLAAGSACDMQQLVLVHSNLRLLHSPRHTLLTLLLDCIPVAFVSACDEDLLRAAD